MRAIYLDVASFATPKTDMLCLSLTSHASSSTAPWLCLASFQTARAVQCHRWFHLLRLWWAMVCHCPRPLSLIGICLGHVCCPCPLWHRPRLSSCIATRCIRSLWHLIIPLYRSAFCVHWELQVCLRGCLWCQMRYQVSYKCIFSNRSGSRTSGSKSGSANMSGTGSGGGPEGC